jgi:hypothetical protein
MPEQSNDPTQWLAKLAGGSGNDESRTVDKRGLRRWQLVPICFECFPKRRELATSGCAYVTVPTNLPRLRSKRRSCIRRSGNNQGRCAGDQDHGGRAACKNERLVCIQSHDSFSVVIC